MTRFAPWRFQAIARRNSSFKREFTLSGQLREPLAVIERCEALICIVERRDRP